MHLTGHLSWIRIRPKRLSEKALRCLISDAMKNPLQHAKGQVTLGQECRFESVTKAIFTGKALKETRAGGFKAVTVEVGGRAYYTGRASFTLEPEDPLGGGFLLR